MRQTLLSGVFVLLPAAAFFCGLPLCEAQEAASQSSAGGVVAGDVSFVSVDNARVVMAPYVWKRSGAGPTARAEATMPGAYVKAVFRQSPTVGLVIDGAATRGCPVASMPVIEYSIDDGPYRAAQLTKSDSLYTFPLAEKLDREKTHRLELYFRAADLGVNRWSASTAHLRIAGLELAAGGTLSPCPKRPKLAICFGDSITEGVGVDGRFTSWQLLGVNNARGSWCPIVCAALDCEYGQLGTGGQGVATKTMAIPPLPQTWDRYDAATSRLTQGMLLPEPDYVFCSMGTNDFRGDPSHPIDITEDYTRWLIAVRKACPHARIFCITPPLGWHAREIQAAVASRNKAGDAKVDRIDTSALKDGFDPKLPTRFAYDGVHPSMYGNAILGASIAAQAQKAIRDAR
jgi:lysophospholipase L1-like esterase